VDVTKTVLESNGFEVEVAYNGGDARKAAVKAKPDAIVLDVMMETKTAGFEVARWLRSEPGTKNIPVIMLTAVNQEFPFKFGADEIWLPVDVFLEKPVTPEQLLSAVKKATKQET
jgi:CheY-like chemotaxis protein